VMVWNNYRCLLQVLAYSQQKVLRKMQKPSNNTVIFSDSSYLLPIRCKIYFVNIDSFTFSCMIHLTAADRN
ncbi:MAG: hypothetical protein ACRCY2_05130, partial [Bombilactobacillus sp.]